MSIVRWVRSNAPFFVVTLALAISAGGMLLREQVNFSSDQAVPALMALEIRDLGVHPVFYWGVQYGGSVEPHLLSVVFRLFPPTLLAYRLTMLLLFGAAIAFIAAATARAFGRTSGLLAALYLALGPSFLIFKSLTSDGAYVSFMTTLSAVLFLGTWIANEEREWRIQAAFFAFGAALGLAWWILPLAIVVLPVFAIPILREPRRWFRPLRILLILAGFAVGSLPWWIENFRTGFLSLKTAELAPSTTAGLVEQVAILFRRGLPVLLGGRSPGARIPTFPGSEAISLGLLFLLLVVGVVLVLRETLPTRRFLASASVGFLVFPALLCFTVARTNLREDPRYLLAMYLGLAPLVGILLSRLWQRPRPLAAVLMTLVLVLLGPLSQWRSPSYGDDARHGRFRQASAAARQLDDEGPREIYAEYWTAYRLSFLSGGHIVASPGMEGAGGPVRSARALRIVDDSPHPGFLLDRTTAKRLEAYLISRSVTYESRFVEAFELELVTGLAAKELAEIRGCRCIPVVTTVVR